MSQGNAARCLTTEQQVSSLWAFRVFQYGSAMGEMEITGCFARSWVSFEAMLADWLNHDAVKPNLQDRQIIIVRSAGEERWYMICAAEVGQEIELRFLQLTEEDRTTFETGIAMGVANFSSAEYEADAQGQSADQESRISRLQQENNWRVRIRQAAIAAV